DYDINGNQVESTDLGVLKVDIENRIYEYESWRYRYDPFGRRVEKRETGGSYWLRFYYDGVTCIQEFVTAEQQGFGPGDPIPVECPDPFWTRIYGAFLVDQILWGAYDTNVDGAALDRLYFHLDSLGTVIMLTDDTGSDPTIVESYRYDEYGQPYFTDGDGN